MTEADIYALFVLLFFFLGLLLYFWVIKLLSSLCRFLDAKTKDLEHHD